MELAPPVRVERPRAPRLQRCGGVTCPSGSCRHDDQRVSRAGSGPGPAIAPSLVREVLATPGSALHPALRTDMERRLGHDFGAVRVHADSRAATSADAVASLAYTAGNHVVLGRAVATEGEQGRRVLAHELVHTIQQGSNRSGVGPLPVSGPSDAGERRRVLAHGLAHTIRQGRDPSGSGLLPVSGPSDSSEREAEHLAQAAMSRPVGSIGPGSLAGVGHVSNPPVHSGMEPLTVSRWASLGYHSWQDPLIHSRTVRISVNVGTEAEWRELLANMDNEDDYKFAQGFLEVANDPSVVGQREHPNDFANYKNMIMRAPNDEEVMAFMRALYSLGSDLDLPNTVFEGGPFIHYLRKEFSELIARYQGRVIQEASARGEVISIGGVTAVAEQGGEQIRRSMIINAGATAMKGIDLVKTANSMAVGSERQVARRNAFETIRNAGRTIKAVLDVHDAEIAFQQAAIGMVFESVWEMIPAGGALAIGAKEFLKLGLSRMLQDAAENDSPKTQAEAINAAFVQTVNNLVPGGHIDAADANGAINGFEAVRR
jgi:hypothetical protein